MVNSAPSVLLIFMAQYSKWSKIPWLAELSRFCNQQWHSSPIYCLARNPIYVAISCHKITGQWVLNNSVFISGFFSLENNLQKVWSRMSGGKPVHSFHLFLNNELKPLEIRTQALNATFHQLLCPRHCLSKNINIKGFKLALTLWWKHNDSTYHVCLARILELYKCKAPEMKQNKQ